MEVLIVSAVSFANTTLLCTLLLASLVALVVFWGLARSKSNENVDCKSAPLSDHEPPSQHRPLIPFVVIEEPRWRDLGRAIDQYHDEKANILNGLSRSLEVARMSEWDVFGDMHVFQGVLTESLQHRLDRMSPLLDHDEALLRTRLLKPFPVRKVLPQQEELDGMSSSRAAPHRPPNNLPPPRSIITSREAETSSYDSAPQAIAHIVRDWSSMGQSIRSKTYDWCRQQLDNTVRMNVLVPGAGLGRLAFDLTCDGHIVEANDSSLVMAAAAYSLLQDKASGTLHPFLMDFFVNEVDSQARYRAVSFPDVDMHPQKGALSFTIGDFVDVYGSSHSHNRFGAVVTCFFLDTATNVYDYLSVISNVLDEDGIWVNVGPLQWHRNALLHPSADELKRIIESMGFDITYWSIDQTPVDYRMEEESTKYEAYRPIRMVAVRRRNERSFLGSMMRLPRKRVARTLSPCSRQNKGSQGTVKIEEL